MRHQKLLLISAILFATVLSASVIADSSAELTKIKSGLVAADMLNDAPQTMEELEANQTYWFYGGSAEVIEGSEIDFFKNSEGLQIGVKSPSNGNWSGFYAVSPPTNATLAHAVITLPSRTIPSNFADFGLYVQTHNGSINYVTCAAVVSSTGVTWGVVYASGNVNQATQFENLWLDPSPEQPLTRECTIITDGDSYLKVYLDGEKVYENSSLSLNMPSPFQFFLETQTSYADGMLYGKFADYYVASEYIEVNGLPENITKVDVYDMDHNLLESSDVSNGVAYPLIGKYHFPLDGSIEVYDSEDVMVASLNNISIFGGDVYSFAYVASNETSDNNSTQNNSTENNSTENNSTQNTSISSEGVQSSADSATITWNTETNATSRVVYDTVSRLELNMSDVNYGYAFSSANDTTKVTNHSVTITGLSPSTTYYYRTASAASPENVSEENNFTTQSPPPQNNQPAASSGGGGGGGSSKKSKSSSSAETAPASSVAKANASQATAPAPIVASVPATTAASEADETPESPGANVTSTQEQPNSVTGFATLGEFSSSIWIYVAIAVAAIAGILVWRRKSAVKRSMSENPIPE